MLLARSVQHFFERSEIRTRAEVSALSVDGNHTHGSFAQREECLGELVGGSSIQRIFLFRSRESDSADRSLGTHPNILHAPAGSPSRWASASGTSSVIRNSAVEYTLPCASVFSERVPPPSSAP